VSSTTCNSAPGHVKATSGVGLLANTRNTTLALVIGLLIGGGVTYVLAGLSSHPTTTTPTITSTNTTTIISTVSLISGPPWVYTSGVSADGLDLKVTLNSTSVHSRGAVGAEIQVANTLDQDVSVSMPPASTIGSGDIYTWSVYDQVCADNPSDYIVAFALFQGHYSPANISAGTPLLESPIWESLCGAGFNPPGAVTFRPNSDVTNYTFNAEVNATTYYCNSNNCDNSSGLLGYWNAPPTKPPAADLNYTSPAFSYFPPGEYTIVATDAWNQFVYVTFVVD
jgi:hypothetical protein